VVLGKACIVRGTRWPCERPAALVSCSPSSKRACAETVQREKEVDELRETLHNLASLLLTNKTIRTTQQGSKDCLFFNNQQSISVGV
jgi:hypothetical protein